MIGDASLAIGRRSPSERNKRRQKNAARWLRGVCFDLFKRLCETEEGVFRGEPQGLIAAAVRFLRANNAALAQVNPEIVFVTLSLTL